MRPRIILTFGVVTFLVCTACAAEMITVTPVEDERVILHNPDMGWVLYENYPVDPSPGGSSTMVMLPNETFEGVAEVAVMFSWFDVERRKDEYDFAAVDRAYDYWKKRGKRIQLRMSTETLLWWDNATPPRGKGPPDYVLAKLADDRKQRREVAGLPPYVVVDARDPYYLDRLEKFLAAVAQHYRGERAVTLIDLRGFGVWGEWHSGFRYPSIDERRGALMSIIDRYSKAFKDNWVSLSYSYDPDGPPDLYAGPVDRFDEASTKSYADYLHHSAFDHALKKANVTFRRDGCGGAVHSNERKLCEQAFATLTKGPFMSEFMDGYEASKKGAKGWVEWKVEDALSLHPNYVNLLGYQAADALAFMRERRDLFDHGLRTMGYRFVPTKLTYPPVVSRDERFHVKGEWVNRGVGRAMRNFRLRVVLADADGKLVGLSEGGMLGTDKWVKGSTYGTETRVTCPNVPEGEYDLHIGLADPSNDRAVGLALKDAAADGTCRVGRIRVEK